MELDVRASQDGQVHTIHVGASTLDAELVDYLAIALDDVERGPCSNLVIVFEGGATTTVGDFPAWSPSVKREDMRYFGRWEDLVMRLSKARLKTLVGYRGRCGSAALQIGLVSDLRVASVKAHLSIDGLAGHAFPAATAFRL